jgi:hypothetical protein
MLIQKYNKTILKIKLAKERKKERKGYNFWITYPASGQSSDLYPTYQHLEQKKRICK